MAIPARGGAGEARGARASPALLGGGSAGPARARALPARRRPGHRLPRSGAGLCWRPASSCTRGLGRCRLGDPGPCRGAPVPPGRGDCRGEGGAGTPEPSTAPPPPGPAASLPTARGSRPRCCKGAGPGRAGRTAERPRLGKGNFLMMRNAGNLGAARTGARCCLLAPGPPARKRRIWVHLPRLWPGPRAPAPASAPGSGSDCPGPGPAPGHPGGKAAAGRPWLAAKRQPRRSEIALSVRGRPCKCFPRSPPGPGARGAGSAPRAGLPLRLRPAAGPRNPLQEPAAACAPGPGASEPGWAGLPSASPGTAVTPPRHRPRGRCGLPG